MALVLILLFSFSAAFVQAAGKQVQFRDDFDSFSASGPDANWFYFGVFAPDGTPLFVGNDGVETTSADTGLRVTSPLSVATGQPAFTSTLGQEGDSIDNPFGLPGALDHVKWLVFANRLASSGFPGFDANAGEVLTVSAAFSGRTYGTEAHPFGPRVKADDPRLAAVALNAVDFESWMVFDFFVTNDRLYAIYERLPFGRETMGNYAAFTFMVPLAKRKADHSHDLQIAYDRSAGVVRWLVDGKEEFHVDQIGYHIERKYMTIDHGGVQEAVEPRQLAFGMGMFSLLDAHLPSREGLVRLSTFENFYFDPKRGEPVEQTFIDDTSARSSRLFGQGTELNVTYVEVSTTAAGDKRD